MMETFLCYPPVPREGEVRQALQVACCCLHGPVGQLGTGADVQPLEGRLVLHQSLHRVVRQLLTAMKTQFLQNQTRDLRKRPNYKGVH